MKATIRDVAKAAGVSVATASMALNNRAGVNVHTRQKVLEVAERMNYVASYSAQSLVTRESGCIGLLLPEIQNPFYSAIVDNISRLAEINGLTLLLGITNNSPEQEEKYVRYFLSRSVQGVIAIPILNRRRSDRHIDMLRSANVPIVFCTERYSGSREPVVMCDFEQGEYEATKYLVDRGLREFCFVSMNIEAQFTTLRYAGYVRALEEAGIPVRDDRTMRIETPTYEQAYHRAGEFLTDRPEAIVCINDIMTMAIIRRLCEEGLRIPGDISVIGFDDIMFSALVSPPLSTVHQPIQEICEKTMQILVDMISAGRQNASDDICLIPARLVIRETTI